MCVSCQLYVFELEQVHSSLYPGGDNSESNAVTKARKFLLSFNFKLFKIPCKKVSSNIAVADYISEGFFSLF